MAHIVARLTCITALLLTSGCGVIGFRDQGARPLTPAHDRAQRMRIELAHGPDYYLAPPGGFLSRGGTRSYALIDIGYANPLWSWTNRELNAEDPAHAERPLGFVTAEQCPAARPRTPACHYADPADAVFRGFAVQLLMPVAFHLLWDPFTENAPIVNTDYEFGGEVAGRVTLSHKSEALASLYLGHISTHIGDEYTIYAREQATPFPRINVSYEPMRMGVGYRHLGPRGDSLYALLPKREWKVVANFESSCIPGTCGSNPYYNIEPTENDGYPVPLTREGVEGSLAASLTWRREITFPKQPFTRVPAEWHIAGLVGMQNVFPYQPGLERTPPAELPLERAIALNLVLGRTFQRPAGSLPGSWYVRLYHGPNPFGQLRNQRDFTLVGAGVTFSR